MADELKRASRKRNPDEPYPMPGWEELPKKSRKGRHIMKSIDRRIVENWYFDDIDRWTELELN